MKLRLLSITALLFTVVATPVRADIVRQTNEQHTIQRSGDYDWEWDRQDRDRRDDVNQRVEVEVNRQDRDWDRRDSDRYDNFYDDLDQIYQEVLGRNVDNKGLRTYSRRLEKGDSLRDIRFDIALGNEAKDVVKNLYRDVTGRNASRSTINQYTRKLADGWTLNDVEDDIATNE